MSAGTEARNRGIVGAQLWRVLVGIVVVASALVAVAAWAVSSPQLTSPDEPMHIAGIWCRSSAGEKECVLVSPADSSGMAKVEVPSYREACFKGDALANGNCETVGPTRLPISVWAYPSAFYNYVSLFAGPQPMDSYYQMRMAVGGSVVAIMALAYLVSLPWLRGAMVVSWVLASMPLGISLYSSLSPSAWAIAGLAAMWGPAITMFRAEDVRQKFAAAGVFLLAAVMAAGSRTEGAIFVAILSLCAIVLLIEVRPLSQIWRQWLPIGVSVLAVGLGMLFFLTSGLARAADTSFSESAAQATTDGSTWSIIAALPALLLGGSGAPWTYNSTVAGSLGWFDVPVQPGVLVAMLMAIGALTFTGLRLMSLRKGVALVLLGAVAALVPARALLQVPALVGQLFQPRYILPMVCVLIGISLLGPGGPKKQIQLTAVQVTVAVIGVTYAGALSLHGWIRRYVTGIDVIDINLNDRLEWWDFSWAQPQTVWLLGSCAWLVVTLFAMSRFLTAPSARTSRPKSPAAG